MPLSTWDLLAPTYWRPDELKELRAERTGRFRSDPTIPFRAKRLKRCLPHKGRRLNLIRLAVGILALILGTIGIALLFHLDALRTFSALIAGAALFSAIAFALAPATRTPPEPHIARSLRVNTFFAVPPDVQGLKAFQLESRIRYWKKRLANRPVQNEFAWTLRQLHWAPRWLMILGFFGFAAQSTLDLIAPGGHSGSFPLTNIGIFGSLALYMILHARLRRRLRGALDQESCPDCAYDLRACPPAIPREQLSGQLIGPERCPECGSLWPLLPPPVISLARTVISASSVETQR